MRAPVLETNLQLGYCCTRPNSSTSAGSCQQRRRELVARARAVSLGAPPHRGAGHRRAAGHSMTGRVGGCARMPSAGGRPQYDRTCRSATTISVGFTRRGGRARSADRAYSAWAMSLGAGCSSNARVATRADNHPTSRGRPMARPTYIAVAGNIGCGKSTLVDFMCRTYDVQPFYEPNATNPYLQDFYKDMN